MPEAPPLRQRGTVAVALMAIVIVASLASLWTDLDELSIVNRALDGERVTLGEAQDADDWAATVALATFVVFVLTIIAFLLWYSRAYRNAIALGLRNPRWGTRWAVWYWFIPIANLFRPKQVLNDIWRGSDPELQRPAPPGWEDRPVSALIHWWWALWIGSEVINRIAFGNGITGRSESGTSLDSLHDAQVAYVAADAASIVTGVIAILAIRAITDRLEERRRRAEAGELLEAPAQRPPSPSPAL